jgi:hypothetical protein
MAGVGSVVVPADQPSNASQRRAAAALGSKGQAPMEPLHLGCAET